MEDEAAESFSVRIWRDPETQRILKQEWRDERGELHRLDGPAIEKWAPSGSLISQEYYRHGRRHRDNGPARIEFHPQTHTQIGEGWALDGHWHRDGDQPALVERDPSSGVAIEMRFFQFGKLHRENGPSLVERDRESGVATRQSWTKRSQAHRDGDKPSTIERDPITGIVVKEHYAKNGY